MHWSWRLKNASSAPLTTRPSVGSAKRSRSAVVKTFSGVHFAGKKSRSQSSLCPKPLSCNIVHHGKIAYATSTLGQSLQIDAPAARAQCPLYLQQRPNIGTATKRREMPTTDVSSRKE